MQMRVSQDGTSSLRPARFAGNWTKFYPLPPAGTTVAKAVRMTRSRLILFLSLLGLDATELVDALPQTAADLQEN
jgi:hypothetical protein